MRKYLFGLVIASILLSEITLRINQELGFFLYIFLITGALISFSKIEQEDSFTKLIPLFLILPVIRIIDLFVFSFDFLWRVLIAYYSLLFLGILYSVKFKINPGYTKRMLYLLPLVIFLSVSLGMLGNYFFEFNKHSEIIFLIPLIAFSEELFFRGLIQNSIKEVNGKFAAVLFTSLLYALFSFGVGFPTVLFIFLVSLIISTIYNFSENIFLTTCMNIVIQIYLFIL